MKSNIELLSTFISTDRKVMVHGPALDASNTLVRFLCEPQSPLVCVCADKGKRIHDTRKYLQQATAPAASKQILRGISPILYSLLELRNFDYDMNRRTVAGKIDAKKTYRQLFPEEFFELTRNREFDFVIFWRRADATLA